MITSDVKLLSHYFFPSKNLVLSGLNARVSLAQFLAFYLDSRKPWPVRCACARSQLRGRGTMISTICVMRIRVYPDPEQNVK